MVLLALLSYFLLVTSFSIKISFRNGYTRLTPHVLTPLIKVQEIFFNTTFRVVEFLTKSDSWVSENEIRQARQVM